MLAAFNVSPSDMSPPLSKFDSPSELLSVYKIFLNGKSFTADESTEVESEDKSAPTSDLSIAEFSLVGVAILTYFDLDMRILLNIFVIILQVIHCIPLTLTTKPSASQRLGLLIFE